MRNKLISFCLAVLILTALPLTAAAQEFDSDRKGSISVSMASNDGVPMVGAEFSVFHVAEVEMNADGKLAYYYVEDFSDCGTGLDDPALVSKLDAFVTEHPVDCQKVVTDSQGKVACAGLPLGLYFVKQTGVSEGFAPCASFLVTVPLQTDGGFRYDVDASPKTDVAKFITITIKKVWNTGKSVAIPNDVTVQLLRDETVVDTATLNEANNWQTIYPNMPESDGYRIKEVNVPKGFTATYTRNGYVFTVTNTASLAQTGQLIWPIPVLAAAGLLFLLMGFALLRKSENGHG